MKNNYSKTKRGLCTLLALIMVFITACSGNPDTVSGSQSIDSATADIMRLEQFEGNITIENSVGQDIEPFAGMRLQSGYSVKTGADGYAFISLDESKAIKLDTSSSTTINYDGKSLLITLDTGNLFFNVTKPLADDENMNIQTSNMITGIRGTSGIVSAIGEESETTILTGQVVVNATEGDDKDKLDDVDLPAGKTAYYDEDDEIDKITIDEITASSLSDFALKSIADEDDLIDEIIENGNFDSDELKGLLEDFDDDNDADDDDDDDADDDDDEDNDSDINDIDDDDDEDSSSSNDINDNNDDDDDSKSGSSGATDNNDGDDDDDDIEELDDDDIIGATATPSKPEQSDDDDDD